MAVKPQRLLLLVALLIVAGSSARPAPPPVRSWEFVVAMGDPSRGLLDITMTLRGFTGPVGLCLFMPNTESYVSAVKRLSPGPAITFEDDCWRLKAAQPQGTSLSYRFDLRALAEQQGQVDWAARYSGTYVWNDQAVLLHPSPYPRPDDPRQRPPIDVEFRLPAGIQVVTPWTRIDEKNAASRFRFDSDQHDGGSYITMGREIDYLGTISAGQTVSRVHIVTLPHHTPRTELITWLTQALQAVAKFYGDYISRQISIVLIPVSGSSEPGIYGTVVRRGVPSVIIYFGGDCKAPQIKDDWVAVHELFHIGNPVTEDRIGWFGEGFTTYYADILRARVGAMTGEQAFGDMYDGFRRFCQPENRVSLEEESLNMQRTHRYRRVYWGGACLAFVADAVIRTRSGGKRSLDDVMLRLRKQSLREPVDADDVITVLDEETGNKLVSSMLREKKSIPFADWFKQLGIEPTGPEAVRFNDSAPHAAMRKAMLQ